MFSRMLKVTLACSCEPSRTRRREHSCVSHPPHCCVDECKLVVHDPLGVGLALHDLGLVGTPVGLCLLVTLQLDLQGDKNEEMAGALWLLACAAVLWLLPLSLPPLQVPASILLLDCRERRRLARQNCG